MRRAVELGAMNDGERSGTRPRTYILAQMLTGSGLQLLMNTEMGNGLEAWTQSVRREEPPGGSACVGHLTALLRATRGSKTRMSIISTASAGRSRLLLPEYVQPFPSPRH